MKNIKGSAQAFRNPKFFSMITTSQGMLRFGEPDVEPIYLGPEAEDELLGHSLRQAISKSRTVSVEEFHEIVKSGILETRAKECEAWEKKTYGYKTKRALYHKMDCCLVRVAKGQIGILPTDRDSLDGSSATADGMQNMIYVSVSASDPEVGAALREGFNRCTHSYEG